MLKRETAIDMVEELSWDYDFSGVIVIEVFTVDGNFVTKRLETNTAEALDYLENEVKKQHRLTLTIR